MTRRWYQVSIGELLALLTGLAAVYAVKRHESPQHIAIGTAIFVSVWFLLMPLMRRFGRRS
jgi:hypothetical protein